MGWADEPPDEDLISSDWASAPPDDDLKDDYWRDVRGNVKEALTEDLPKAAEAMGGSAMKMGRAMLPGQMLQSGLDVLGGKRLSETPVGEGAQALYDVGKGGLEGVWQGIKDTGSAIKAPFELLGGDTLAETEFGEKFRERPIGAPLGVVGTVAPVASMGLKALRGLRGVGVAGEAAGSLDDIAAGASKAEIPLEPLPRGVSGKGATLEAAEDFANAPPKPPPPGAGKPPPNPRQEIYDFLAEKYKPHGEDPSRVQRAGQYLQNLSQELGAKDIGMQPRQIQSMGSGFLGLERAEALIDYARDKGYFSPTLNDVARKAKIKQGLETSGQQVSGVREFASQRGVPPIAELRQQLQKQLTNDYGIDAPAEIKKVLKKFDKAANENPTFSGMADLATELNKAKTPSTKMGQHPGPTTDAANMISRINNDAIRKVLNPQEAQLYDNALNDFGAHKKLEQAVAASGRRSASARSNQRGLLGRLFQEALDRGGYRIAGNISHGLGKRMVSNPERFKTMPQLFEEFAHEAGDVFDDIVEGPQYAYGGIVEEVGAHIESKYGKK